MLLIIIIIAQEARASASVARPPTNGRDILFMSIGKTSIGKWSKWAHNAQAPHVWRAPAHSKLLIAKTTIFTQTTLFHISNPLIAQAHFLLCVIFKPRCVSHLCTSGLRITLTTETNTVVQGKPERVTWIDIKCLQRKKKCVEAGNWTLAVAGGCF